MEVQRGIVPSSDEGRQPVKLIFELTNLCNFQCPHCIREEGSAAVYLPVSLVERVLDQAQLYHNVGFVAFTGGEPTLHPEFAGLLPLVAAYGHRFGFVTNGWRFAEKTLEQVKPHREHLAHVTFSIDGATEATHDALRRRKGSFRRLMQAIMLCRFHGISVHVNMVITRNNRSELEAMAMLASRLECDALLYGHCQPTPHAVAAGLVLSPTERREVEHDIADLQRLFRTTILLAGDHYNPSRFYQCPQLQMREINIDSRGRLTACCMLSGYRGGTPDTDIIADLNEVSLYEGHKRLVAQIARINEEKIDRLVARQETDDFICTHCLEHYRKLPRSGARAALPILTAVLS
jgi:MoaA/NifB/PqqE/SkfB family radical SAM enzyme